MFVRNTLLLWVTMAVVFVMWSIAPNMAEAELLFQPRVDYQAGDGAFSVAIGDLDGDGDQDLAVANHLSADVSVLLGNGNGTFENTEENPSVGELASSVAIGDLNGDGNLDLAVANHWWDNVSVLLGNGDGSFQSAKNYPAGDGPFSVAIGYLNGDDKLDLALGNHYSHDVSILLGNGDGTFQSTDDPPSVGDGPTFSVAIGYLNEDDKLDLAVANCYSNDVSVLLGDGDGKFQNAVNYETGDHPNSVAIGDLNGDGNQDLAVANCYSDDVSVLLGNGDGTFQSTDDPPSVGDGPYFVAIGDFNGDGNLDLAVANLYGDNVSVLFGNGDGSFQSAKNYQAGDGPHSIAIKDLNGDNKPDMAVANCFSDDVSVFINALNEPPTADPNGPYLGAAGSPIAFTGSGSSDPDDDPMTYSWDFGDETTGSGETPSHTYAAASIYDVCLIVNDGQVDSEEVCTFAVVYDPSAGFVTGGGWIDSQEGAYKLDTSLTGKANFGFVTKYKKGAGTPTGQTEFQFQTAYLNFHSESYDWLIVNQGGTNAQFKGEGTINGDYDENGNAYKFMIWAGDDSPDTFRIQIWSEDEVDGVEYVVYDNGVDQEISGGQIVIHTKK